MDEQVTQQPLDAEAPLAEQPAVAAPVEVDPSLNCVACSGSGLQDEKTLCPACFGKGKVA